MRRKWPRWWGPDASLSGEARTIVPIPGAVCRIAGRVFSLCLARCPWRWFFTPRVIASGQAVAGVSPGGDPVTADEASGRWVVRK
jgi:hypothetical protein